MQMIRNSLCERTGETQTHHNHFNTKIFYLHYPLRWIGEGLTQWYKAMRCALFVVAFQAQHAHPVCRRLVESVQALRVQITGSTDWRPNDEFEFQCWSRFDGLLKSQVVDDLCSAFTHLAGQYIMFEMGDGEENQSRYIPIPDCLSFMPRGQAASSRAKEWSYSRTWALVT